MTREEIENMPAGDEINSLVAHKIMGYINGRKTSTYADGTGDWWTTHIPDYSIDIEEAWQVVEKMQSNGFCFDADGNALRKRFRFGVGQEIGEAKTAPLAICRAALLAVMDK